MSGNGLAIAAVIVLVVLSGLSAGLEVGLFSIDTIFIRVWSTAGDEKQKKMSQKLLKFVNRYHWTLVALILFNASCMMTLPIVLDSLVDPVTALILSITVVLFVGEVIPLALFVRHAIPICSFFSPVIWASIVVTAPLSYPVGRFLDYILGTQEELLDRDELAALILPQSSPTFENSNSDELEMEMEEVRGGKKEVSSSPSCRDSLKELTEEENAFRLRGAEIRMLQGAMQLTQDKVINHMHTTTANIFMLSSQQALDRETIEAIIHSGYSRIPVYFGDDHRHVIGALIVNSLVKLCFTNPDPPPLVSNYPLREVMRLSETATLYDAYMAFREGISNMAVIYNSIGVMMGLLTLTDVLAALYQGDPSEDRHVDAHGVRRTDKMVGVMEGVKFLSQTKHIESLVVAADRAASMLVEADPPRVSSPQPFVASPVQVARE